MCGIAGFSLAPDDVVNAKRLAKNLLLGIENRGRHATGFAFVDPTGMVQTHKAPLTASDFVKRRLCVPRRATQAILHTRAATQGEPKYNENNHPVEVEHIVGVHNGVLYNDFAVFRELSLTRPADVDSAAIFAALAVIGDPKEALEVVEGSMATAWFDRNNPEFLHLARGHDSPLFVGMTAKGSMVFASDSITVRQSAEAVGLTLVSVDGIREGVGMKFAAGGLLESWQFKPDPGKYSWVSDYDWPTSGRTVTRTVTTGSSAPTAPRSLHRDARWGDYGIDALVTEAFSPGSQLGLSEWEHDIVYGGREAKMTTYLDRMLVHAENKAQEFDIRESVERELHGLLRVGDQVTTRYADTWVRAQVVAMPQTFPDGAYTLRVLVENNDRSSGTEMVLIEREHDEFVSTSVIEQEETLFA